MNERRDRYPEDEDISFFSKNKSFKVSAILSGLNDVQKGLFITSYIPPENIKLGLTYEGVDIEKNQIRGRSVYWSGEQETKDPERESNKYIRYVYLPPLRDAITSLNYSQGKRVKYLAEFLCEQEKINEFVELAQKNLDILNKHDLVTSISHKITEKLSELSEGAKEQETRLEFLSADLLGIARNLKFKLANAGYELNEINHSGLGYANLLYISTVLVELDSTRETDLTIFLVEEPEAHLHPQLQMILLELLKEYCQISSNKKIDPSSPEGKIQVVVTTHSPNLTASVSVNEIEVIKSNNNQSIAIPIWKLGIPPKEINKIDRYLNVTRVSMLFSNRVVLIEGLSEALLFPIIAKYIVFKNKDSDMENDLINKKKLLKFIGATFIAIDGVDFIPYLKLLRNSFCDVQIADSVLVMTDDDIKCDREETSTLSRISKAKEILGDANVIVSKHTLEAELIAADNEEFLKKVYLEMHPYSETKWKIKIQDEMDAEKKTCNFVELIKKNKGEFAQIICEKIIHGEKFNVPKNIREVLSLITD